MPWKPIAEQLAIAALDGKVRQLLVIAWNSDRGAIQVEWPPTNPDIVTRHRYSMVRKTTINLERYEPLDPDAFRTATRG